MRNILSLAAAVLLTFVAISLLMAALQYSSDLIRVPIQNETNIPTDVQVHGAVNSTGTDSPNSTGALQSMAQNSGKGLSLENLTSLMTGGGGPKKPDDPEDQPNYLLIILIILLVLAFLTLVGYILWRRRRKGQKTPASLPPVAGPAYFEGDYRIRFPQIGEPFPVIWGENEPLVVVIEGKNGAADDVGLDIDGKMIESVRLEAGRAQLRLTLDKGDHRVTAGQSWAIIRIVDYREEIVRMYNEMYLNYRSRYEGIGDTLTPRELEQAVGQKIPEAGRSALDAAVTIFEFANFSLHGMGRRDFERMYLSGRDVA